MLALGGTVVKLYAVNQQNHDLQQQQNQEKQEEECCRV